MAAKVVSKPSSATIAQDVLFISYRNMFRPITWPSSRELYKLFKEATVPMAVTYILPLKLFEVPNISLQTHAFGGPMHEQPWPCVHWDSGTRRFNFFP
jgi:hypothetical protein